jgi:hypothetical protein
MREDIEVGDHLLAISAEEKCDPADAEKVIGFNARVIVTRHDGAPVRGSTMADAIAHGEAWGRHFVARILGGAI